MQTGQGNLGYAFDARDQRTLLSDPGYTAAGVTAGQTTHTYDPRGLVLSQINPNGSTTTTTYNEVGQPLQVYHAYANGTEIDHAFYTYDPVGRVTNKSSRPPQDVAQLPGVIVTYSSVSGGHLPATVVDGDRTGFLWDFSYGWLGASNTGTDWLELDFPSSQTISEVDVFTLQDGYEYGIDPTPDLLFSLYGTTALTLQYWNGSTWQTLSTLTGNANVWMTFRFAAVTTTKLRLNITQIGDYGRIVAVEAYAASTAGTLYTYDALDQLIVVNDPAVGLFTYSYDRAFNRRTQAAPDGLTTYAYDAANQLLWTQDRTGYTTYSYDANGNTSLITAREGITTQTWDMVDRLAGMQLPASVSQPHGRVLTYGYRYDGMLSQKSGPRGAEILVWDGQTPLFWSGPSRTTQLYVWGDEAIRAVGATGGSVPVARQFHLDAQSNVQKTTTVTYAPEYQMAWEAFGSTVLGQSAGNPLDYGGGMGLWNDFDSPLTYVRARWLDPSTGRWMSQDPVESEHAYTFAANNPILYFDPSGTQIVRPDKSHGSAKSSSRKQQASCGTCGPEVGFSLRQILRDVDNAFGSWSQTVRDEACRSLWDVVVGGVGAWDIEQLFGAEWKGFITPYREDCNCATDSQPLQNKGGKTEKNRSASKELQSCTCVDTVMVDGQCHIFWAVNYVIYGHMWRLCRDHATSAASDSTPHFTGSRGPIKMTPIDPHEFFTQEKMEGEVTGWKSFAASPVGHAALRVRQASVGEYHAEDAIPANEWARAGFNNWGVSSFPTPPARRAYCTPCKIPVRIWDKSLHRYRSIIDPNKYAVFTARWHDQTIVGNTVFQLPKHMHSIK